MAKQRPEILALHLGWDIADVRDCRYQPTRYRDPIYTVGDYYYYYTVAKVGAKPCTFDLPWERLDSWVTTPYGWEVYVARVVAPGKVDETAPEQETATAPQADAGPTEQLRAIPVGISQFDAVDTSTDDERERAVRQMTADSGMDERYRVIFERLHAKGWRKPA